MVAWVIPGSILGPGQESLGNFGIADLRITASFAIIEVAIFLSEFLTAGVVLNYNGLVYFKTVQ